MSDKIKALEMVISKIEKEFGKGSVMRLGERGNFVTEVISTGSLLIDQALGIGGMPKGRIIEIYGPESSGKTTIALHVIAEAQKDGGNAVFIDAEHALDPIYARNIGVDIDNLLVSQPDSGEAALEIADALVRSGAVDVVVIDSVAALVPRAELEGSMGDAHIGLQARLMSQAMRKLAGVVAQTKTVVIFINQLREKVGIMFGNPEITPGGKSLKYYSSIRLDVRKKDVIKKDGEVIGNEVEVKVVKNKLAPPFKSANIQIMYGKGIDRIGEILDICVNNNIIEKAGPWFAYKGERVQGRENMKAIIENKAEILKELEEKIKPIVMPNHFKIDEVAQ